MVISTERLQETPPQDFEASLDRPVGRSIYLASEIFYTRHSDLLPENHGVVASVDINNERHTVLFDASQYPDRMAWQHSVLTPGQGRSVDTLQVTALREISGWHAYYETGRPSDVRDLSEAEIQKSWEALQAILATSQAVLQREELRTKRANYERELTEFVLKKTVQYQRAADEVTQLARVINAHTDDNGRVVLTLEKVLSGRLLAEEYDKRSKVLDKLGFTALAFEPKPVVPRFYQPTLNVHVPFDRGRKSRLIAEYAAQLKTD